MSVESLTGSGVRTADTFGIQWWNSIVFKILYTVYTYCRCTVDISRSSGCHVSEFNVRLFPLCKKAEAKQKGAVGCDSILLSLQPNNIQYVC